MKKWNLIIDVEKCEDCNNCFLSCKDEHVDNDWPGYSISQPRHGHRWMNILRKERGHYPLIDVAYLPTPCMHCDNPPCLKKAPRGAVYKRTDGIVIIDPEKAKGHKHIVDSCPYGCIWWKEKENVAQKCTLCAHLLDEGWKEPRCIQVCPTGALRIVKAEDSYMQVIIESENLEVLHPEYNTRPRVYYKNLYRFTSCFIAGSLAVETNGITDCAAGATVVLARDQYKTEIMSDTFGDFKFDGLEGNSGTYRLEISYRDRRKALEIDLTDSCNVGTILL